jgi:hypothetical protein
MIKIILDGISLGIIPALFGFIHYLIYIRCALGHKIHRGRILYIKNEDYGKRNTIWNTLFSLFYLIMFLLKHNTPMIIATLVSFITLLYDDFIVFPYKKDYVEIYEYGLQIRGCKIKETDLDVYEEDEKGLNRITFGNEEVIFEVLDPKNKTEVKNSALFEYEKRKNPKIDADWFRRKQ